MRYALFACLCLHSAFGSAIVVGFVGGFVNQDDPVHEEVRLAARLRHDYPSGVYVRIFEDHSAGQAHQEILRALDADHDGKLSDREKRDARIVLFGHSWGGSEVVAMAWTLQEEGIAVLLTIQVDSVAKHGEQDALIPANVAQAINFYQLDGFVHGRSRIVAADPSGTQILGNIELSYQSREVNVAAYPWYERMFMKPHIEIESDPSVWSRIESLIRSRF